MEFIRKNKKIISIILLALILYIRCDYGVTKSYAVAMNLVVQAIGFVYCLILTKDDFQKTKKSIFNLAILWLILFQVVQFVYGHFKLFTPTDYYSVQYTILTVLPALLCYEIVWHNRDNMFEVLSPVGALVIFATYITSIKYDHLWGDMMHGEFYRVGAVPGGTDIDTGNLYLLMLIPILYSVIVLRKVKPNIIPALAGIIGIVLAGSKSSFVPLVLVIAIMLLGTAKNAKDVKKYVAILVGLGVVATVLVLTIPMLYDILGKRIVEVFTAFGNTEFDLHTSTGQRMAVMDAFKKHFWESPLFGHGFYSFITMPYSQLEEYREGTEIMYRHIQTHMNFMELLFSFGIFGFVMYYWFPVKLIIDTIKVHSKEAKIVCISLLVSILFMDLGLDMFFKYMTPYYTYLLIYTFLNNNSEEG
ncbi:O-antigen ligase family protein [Pseudobutyrivibrio xylanivorans]|uniref:O-antigen ligase n=1 Tax=Pseudobutyrivibrio xylanivorans DSM 14809 TaxID=1123012 RepID=A0A1M6GVT1_PSEXY|nr:O-antigen ligase family protein [Pseudobutyrivibrio xylanivorans]SHJ14046.1 O-antigen ligase [Pseudobutyrivibrio xylanivorans DSM 14809]